MLESEVSTENFHLPTQPESGDEKLLVRFYLRPVLNRLKSEGGEFPIQGLHDPKLKAYQADAARAGYTVEVDVSNRLDKKAIITGAGRPIYDSVEYIELRIPDKLDKFTTKDQPAKERDRRRFRKQYEAFKAATREASRGTPLSAWPLISATQVAELQFLKIDGQPHPVRTIEELAEFPEDFLPYLGPELGKLKQKAQDFLAQAKGQAPMVTLRSELESRDAEIAELRRMILGLQAAKPDARIEVASAHDPIPGPEAIEATKTTKKVGRPRKQVEE